MSAWLFYKEILESFLRSIFFSAVCCIVFIRANGSETIALLHVVPFLFLYLVLRILPPWNKFFRPTSTCLICFGAVSTNNELLLTCSSIRFVLALWLCTRNLWPAKMKPSLRFAGNACWGNAGGVEPFWFERVAFNTFVFGSWPIATRAVVCAALLLGNVSVLHGMFKFSNLKFWKNFIRDLGAAAVCCFSRCCFAMWKGSFFYAYFFLRVAQFPRTHQLCGRVSWGFDDGQWGSFFQGFFRGGKHRKAMAYV